MLRGGVVETPDVEVRFRCASDGGWGVYVGMRGLRGPGIGGESANDCDNGSGDVDGGDGASVLIGAEGDDGAE
jgi:hypothetical protein